MGWGLFACCGDAELDQDIIGDDVEFGPAAFANRKVGAADGEAAFEDAAVALGGEGGGHDDILRFALDVQLAGDFIFVAA